MFPARGESFARGIAPPKKRFSAASSNRNARVPYTVRECSAYSDRRIPSLYFIEKTAWVLLTKKAGRTVGFVTSKEFRKMEGKEIVPTPSGETTLRE